MKVERPQWLNRLVVAMLLVHAALLVLAAARHSPSVCEVPHLAAGISHWHLGRFDLYSVNPPLVRMAAALPVLFAGPKTDWTSFSAAPGARADGAIGSRFVEVNGEASFAYFRLARWACIPLSLVGGYVCYRWARELYGLPSGLLALALWCFCPNILAHAQLITPDAGAAALGAAAGYLFWRWLKEPTWGRALAAGGALGLAELTKTTWIVLFGLWPALWLAWSLAERGRMVGRAWVAQAGQLAAILLMGLYVLNVGYGFEGSFQRLRDFKFVSRPLSGADEETSARRPAYGNRFAQSWAAAIPVPLPKNYVLGIDLQKRDFEVAHPSYLRGQWRHGGWWYYYLYGLAVKVPLGTWALFAMALLVSFSSAPYPAGWRDELVLWLPAAVVLVLVSSQTGLNHHLRYVLPIFPFGFIFVSSVARSVEFKAWKTAGVAAAALAWSITSSLCVYPHSLSYFNELGGGPSGGHAHLVDSNIDWGQDLLYLKRWLDEHPQARPLHLAYFGLVDPRLAGIQFELPPKVPMANPRAYGGAGGATAGPQPGWHAVSVSLLRGRPWHIPDGHAKPSAAFGQDYTYFLRFEPVAMAGYSIYIYHISLEEANRVRRELGLEEVRSAERGMRSERKRGVRSAQCGVSGSSECGTRSAE